MTVVIQYANAYFNLKNQDFWFGRLRTDQDKCNSATNDNLNLTFYVEF